MKRNSILSLKVIFFLFIFSFLPSTVLAQDSIEKPKSKFWKKVRFGSGVGVSVGNGFVAVNVAPTAIYQFNKYVGLGIGLNGAYNSRKNIHKSTVFGGSVISTFNPIKDIQLSAEFEQLNVKRNYNESFVSNADRSYWYPALFLGAGFRSRFATIGIRYDLLYDEDDSIYAEPWVPFIRFSF